jgi:hypothetical protein
MSTYPHPQKLLGFKYTLVIFFSLLILSACGGGGSANNNDPPIAAGNLTAFSVAFSGTNGTGADASGGQSRVTPATEYERQVNGDQLERFKYFTMNGQFNTAVISGAGNLHGLSFGRWQSPGAAVTGFTAGAVNNPILAYVFGTPDTVDGPSTGVRTLALVGGALPMDTSNALGAVGSASANINFAASQTQNAMTVNFVVNMTNAAYAVQGVMMGRDGGPWFYEGNGGRINFTATVTCTGTACGATSSSRAVKLGGMMVDGNRSPTAAVTYVIVDPSATGANKAIVGTAVLR